MYVIQADCITLPYFQPLSQNYETHFFYSICRCNLGFHIFIHFSERRFIFFLVRKSLGSFKLLVYRPFSYLQVCLSIYVVWSVKGFLLSSFTHHTHLNLSFCRLDYFFFSFFIIILSNFKGLTDVGCSDKSVPIFVCVCVCVLNL